MAKKSIWNDILVEKLRSMYVDQGISIINIAKELGVTKNSVIGKIHRLQLNVLKSSNSSLLVGQQEQEEPKQGVVNYNNDETVESNINIKKQLQKDILFSSDDSIFTKINCESNNKQKQKNKYSLADINTNMCVWPIGDKNFHFCGEKTSNGSLYCKEHLQLVYITSKKSVLKKENTSERIEENVEEISEE